MSDTVFISYRRNVSSFIARAIYQDLRAHGYDAFMDVESIDSGEFDTIILRQIVARGHFLIICTPGTFERCGEAGDWLRREVEHALDNGRNVVPIMVNEFKFDAATLALLTGKLAQLPRRNALNLPHDYFDAGMEKLRTRFLKQPIVGEVVATPAADQRVVEQKQTIAAGQPAPTPAELSAEDYFLRALARESTDLEGKIADYSEALRLNPQFAEALNNRGIAYNEQGESDKEIADYNEAIRLKPGYADAYYNRGLARLSAGDFAGAIADYSEAIRFNPQHASAYNNRGNLLSDRGDFDEAIADYDEAIRINAQSASAYNNRGFAKISIRDYDGAIADISKAIELAPHYSAAYDSRAEAYAKKGEYALAIADYERFLELGGGEKENRVGEVEGKISDLKRKLEMQKP